MPGPQSFTLAVFTKNRVNPAYDAARLAVDRVAAEAGARTVHYVPATPDHVAEQKRWWPRRWRTRPDGVLFNPTDDVAMAEDVARFAAAGIPVAVFINRMSAPVLTFVGSDDLGIGHAVALRLFQGLGGTGRIVALDGTPGARTARDRTEGLKRALSEESRNRTGWLAGWLSPGGARAGRDGRIAAGPSRHRRRLDGQRRHGLLRR